MTAAVLDPAAAIAAAGHDLLDQLRELTGRKDTDVPATLLDELTELRDGLNKLLRRARTQARKHAVKLAEQGGAAKPATAPAAVKPAPTAAAPTKPVPAPSGRAVPAAAKPAVRRTVPIAPAKPHPPKPASTGATQPRVAQAARLPRWLHLAVLAVLAVLGVALAVTTGSPLALATTLGAGVAVSAGMRWGIRRRRKAEP